MDGHTRTHTHTLTHTHAHTDSSILLFLAIFVFIINLMGARCSSVVRAFAHGAMVRRIDPS